MWGPFSGARGRSWQPVPSLGRPPLPPAGGSGRRAYRRRWAPTTSCCTRLPTGRSTCPCFSAGTSSGSAQVGWPARPPRAPRTLIPTSWALTSVQGNGRLLAEPGSVAAMWGFRATVWGPDMGGRPGPRQLCLSPTQRWRAPRSPHALCLRSRPRGPWASASPFSAPPSSSSRPTSPVSHEHLRPRHCVRTVLLSLSQDGTASEAVRQAGCQALGSPRRPHGPGPEERP